MRSYVAAVVLAWTTAWAPTASAQREVTVWIGGTSAFDREGPTAGLRVDLTRSAAAPGLQLGMLLGTWVAKTDLSNGGDRLLFGAGPAAFARTRPGDSGLQLQANVSVQALYSRVDIGGYLEPSGPIDEEERSGTTWRALFAGEVGAGLPLSPTTTIRVGVMAGRHVGGVAVHRAVYQLQAGITIFG